MNNILSPQDRHFNSTMVRLKAAGFSHKLASYGVKINISTNELVKKVVYVSKYDFTGGTTTS